MEVYCFLQDNGFFPSALKYHLGPDMRQFRLLRDLEAPHHAARKLVCNSGMHSYEKLGSEVQVLPESQPFFAKLPGSDILCIPASQNNTPDFHLSPGSLQEDIFLQISYTWNDKFYSASQFPYIFLPEICNIAEPIPQNSP